MEAQLRWVNSDLRSSHELSKHPQASYICYRAGLIVGGQELKHTVPLPVLLVPNSTVHWSESCTSHDSLSIHPLQAVPLCFCELGIS